MAAGSSTASSATITQVIRDKKEAEHVAKKLFKDRPGPPHKVKDARKAFKKEEAVKLTRGGGPPIPKPPSGEPPSEEEARRRARDGGTWGMTCAWQPARWMVVGASARVAVGAWCVPRLPE